MVNSSKSGNAKVRPPTLLVVDDEPLIRMSHSDFLRGCGFKVIEANDAEEAVKLITSYAIIIDLVLTDIRMPGDMDGLALARWIGARKPKMPVILCSGHAKEADAINELWADKPFFRKPYNLEKMVATIREVLGLPKNGNN
jgi:DNA-binding NtrC family response regulator